MTNPVGKPLPRAKPITMTFYDTLQTYPYTTTFFVREETSEEECHALIEAVRAVSSCVLGKYKIGYQEYMVTDTRAALKEISPRTMGTHKWLVKYRTEDGSARSCSIPGHDYSLSLLETKGILHRAGKKPDPDHPLWQDFLTIFKRLCVSKEGKDIWGDVTLDITSSNWPPKGWKKKR